MWVLLFTIAASDGVPEITQKLAEYPLKRECISEMYRIQKEMIKAYPNDGRTMTLRCQAVGIVTS